MTTLYNNLHSLHSKTQNFKRLKIFLQNSPSFIIIHASSSQTFFFYKDP